jgi:hypothetical protein
LAGFLIYARSKQTALLALNNLKKYLRQHITVKGRSKITCRGTLRVIQCTAHAFTHVIG